MSRTGYLSSRIQGRWFFFVREATTLDPRSGSGMTGGGGGDDRRGGSGMTGKGGRPCVFLCHPCACEDPASLSFAIVLAPPGGAVPRSRPFSWRRGLSERSEFRSPHTRDRGTGTPSGGPRPGATGFGSFCRNKRTSSCGAETPQSSSPRRVGPTPRRRKERKGGHLGPPLHTDTMSL